MDKILVGIVVVAAVAVCAAIAVWVISLRRERQTVDQAREWPATEATIESGALEATHETHKVVLPTFAFSYQVSGAYYSGRFSLSPQERFPSHALLDSLLREMSGRKLLVRYDPQRPEVWFIPDEFINGCKVEQEVGVHVVHDFYPHG
jgi:Protein of unknown function (DUF3592)